MPPLQYVYTLPKQTNKHPFAGERRYVHFEAGEAVMRRFVPRAHGAYC